MHLKKNFKGKRFNAQKRAPGTNNPRLENQKREENPNYYNKIMETKSIVYG